MRVFSRCCRSRAWAAAGTLALAVGVVVAVTGGFTVRAGPLRLSAHGLGGPLAVVLAAGIALWLHGRDEARAALASVTGALARHATALAVVLAASTAGAGVAFGTFAASATDPSAYVSQAELLVSGRATWTQPLASAMPWPGAAWAFAPLGYRPAVDPHSPFPPGTYVPVYPPGLPLILAAARAAAGADAPYVVTPLFAAVLVLATYGIGRRLHSALAGLAAAVLAATSPVLLFHAVVPMSDVPAAAWWALAAWAALGTSRGSALGAGLASGLAILTRPNLAPLAAPIVLLALSWPRHARPGAWGWGRALVCVAGVALPLLALLGWQHALYGSVLRTGYGDDVATYFAAANILPNVRDYAWRVVRGEAPALVVTAAALAAVLATRERAARLARVAAPVLAACLVGSVLLVLYLPYGVFPDWAYFRFLLPALPFAWACAGALASEAAAARPAAGGVVLVAGLTLAGAVNVLAAEREQAFNLRTYESRYRTVGRYLEASQPRNTVVVTFQESGSVRHYTGLPVVRWDLLDVPLDTAVADLRARGRRVVLLVEDWELPALRERFPASPLVRLDWRPRADFGYTTRVWLYDPLDRGQTGAAYPTDRLR